MCRAEARPPSGFDPNDLEHRLYLARRRAERKGAEESVRMYLPSCSSRTVVYKGLMAGTRLADFYLDLRDESCESRLSVFHQRYSTNTMPDWRLAQPFRLLAHNGEINTVTGNRAWMRAREAELEPELRGVIWPGGSDSASLDNALELLVQRGWEVSEALMSLVPDAWEGRGDLAAAVRRPSSNRGTAPRRWRSATDTWSAPRSTATACVRCAGSARGTGSWPRRRKRAW